MMNIESPDILIRPATIADCEIFLSMLCEFARYEQIEPPDEAAQQRLIKDGFGERKRFEVLIGEVAGEVAGYAIFYEIYSSFLALPKLYIEDLYVRSAQRGSGLGKALFEACAREGEQRGLDRMQWYVEGWNDKALKFYERMGAKKLDWQTWQLLLTEKKEERV